MAKWFEDRSHSDAITRPVIQQPPPRVIQAPQVNSADIPALAQGMLELPEHVTRILNENADLMARVEFLEKHAIARAKIEAA